MIDFEVIIVNKGGKWSTVTMTAGTYREACGKVRNKYGKKIKIIGVTMK